MEHYDHIIALAGLILRVLTMIFAGVFCFRYAKLPWKESPEGRHLMGFSAVVCAFMAWSVLITFMAFTDDTPPTYRPDGDFPGREEIALLLFGFTAWYMFQRNRLLKPGHDENVAKKAEDDLHDDRVQDQSSNPQAP